MARILLRLLLALLCLLASSATARDALLVDDPNLPDSVTIDSVIVTVPQVGIIPVHFSNDELLDGIEIAIISNSRDVRIDSFSFADGRLQTLYYTGSILSDSMVIAFAYPAAEGPIPTGTGLLGRLYVSYDTDISSQLVTFDTTTAYMSDSLVVHSTSFSPTDLPGDFIPACTRGFLDIQRCCSGITGNIDCDPEHKANLADITRLIDRIYLSKVPLCCFASGNTDGDPEWKINLADITKLIDHIYLSKEPTAPCP